MSPDVAPIIRTPSHSAFPSGHATEAFTAATVLAALFPDRAVHLRLMAARIAMNRSFAGVHCAVEHHAGAILGDLLGGIIVKRALGLTIWPAPGGTISFNAGVKPAQNPPQASNVETYATYLTPLNVSAAVPTPVIGVLGHLAARVRSEF